MRVPVQCPDGIGTAVTGEVCDSVSTDECGDVGAGEVCGSDDILITPKISAMSGTRSLIDEQLNDSSLSDCWRQAKVNKGGFVTSNGALYHKDKISDQSICQLCVPVTRRDEVLKLARDSVFGAISGNAKHWRELDCRSTGLV